MFKGRGYVQITGRSNYAAHGHDLGVDLVAHPEKVLDREIAKFTTRLPIM